MQPGPELVPGRGRPRRPLALAVRRAHLAFLLLWRKRWPRMEEVDAGTERTAERDRALEDLRLAAEAYHWAVASERRPPAATRGAAAERAVGPGAGRARSAGPGA
jgi:hypothetical protein